MVGLRVDRWLNADTGLRGVVSYEWKLIVILTSSKCCNREVIEVKMFDAETTE